MARRLVTTALIVSVLLLMGLASGCVRRESKAGASITLAGSTSVQPFAEMLAEEYGKKYPDRSVVYVQGGGSSAGARAAISGAAQIGMMSRELAPTEKELTPIVIAHDAIALVVHPANPVSQLTKEQVKRVFTGEIVDWSAVGGHSGRINVVSREEGSGTRGAFDELVLEGADVAPRAIVQDSNGAVRQTVSQDKMGIGYISLGLVDRTVKAVAVDGVIPTVENTRTGKYTLVRPFLFVYKGHMVPDAEAFADFVLGDEGKKVLASEGLVTSK